MPTNNQERTNCDAILSVLSTVDVRLAELPILANKMRTEINARLFATPQNNDEASQETVDDVERLQTAVTDLDEAVQIP